MLSPGGSHSDLRGTKSRLEDSRSILRGLMLTLGKARTIHRGLKSRRGESRTTLRGLMLILGESRTALRDLQSRLRESNATLRDLKLTLRDSLAIPCLMVASLCASQMKEGRRRTIHGNNPGRNARTHAAHQPPQECLPRTDAHDAPHGAHIRRWSVRRCRYGSVTPVITTWECAIRDVRLCLPRPNRRCVALVRYGGCDGGRRP